MSTLPELLTLYQEAVRLADTLPDQTMAILTKIINDAGCNAQLRMTAEKLHATMLARSKTALVAEAIKDVKEKPRLLKDSVLLVDVFAVESIPHIEDRMPISPEQYNRLKEDIKKRNIQVPLIVTPDFKLLCGYNRLKAAKELGIKTVPVIVKNIPSDKLVEFAVKDNIIRRHMTIQELAAFIEQETTQEAGRPKKGSHAKTIKDISTSLGVSEKTISRAKSFIKKVQKNPALANRSIKSVVEGTEVQDHVNSTALFTVGVDMTDETVSSYMADIIDQIYKLDLNNGDKIRISMQAWRMKRK